MTGLDYTLAFDQPGVFFVTLSSESYGAYPSRHVSTYAFDARTGEVIDLRSLLTPEGLAKLDAEITRARLQRLDDFLAGRPVAGGAQLRSEPADAEEQKQLYRECRTSIERGHPVLEDRLTLDRDTLRLLREPCGPRAIQALDELDFHDTRGFEQIAELLNDYGRCLLIARRTDCQRSYAGAAAGVYRGRIGDRYPITLVIEAVGFAGGIRATYYYDAQARPIPLSGAAAQDGGMQLDQRGSPPARFSLRVQPDGRLLGEWTQEGKAPQRVELR